MVDARRPPFLDSEQWKPLTSNYLNIFLLARGFFITIFDKFETRAPISDFGTCISGSAGFSLYPWFPSFNPITTSISTARVWVRFPNLPLHMWNLSSLTAFGNILNRCYCQSEDTKYYMKPTYACICVEWTSIKNFLLKLS